MAELSSYPLVWPTGWKRTTINNRAYGKFNKKEPVYRDGVHAYNSKKDLTVADGVGRIQVSLAAMGVDRQEVIISTNVKTRLDGLPRSGDAAPSDPGVAVYWRKSHGAQMRCMAIDRYTTVADNLAAIAATLEAMRAIERHGGAEVIDRAFTGFKALNATNQRDWWDVLEVTRECSKETIELNYRRLLRDRHPDTGGSDAAMAELNVAKQQALAELNQ